MAFAEALTREIRKRAHFQCCLCKALGVEIHHIIPQAEDGSDSIDNAAPLCPSCHETYGANPTKRKFIREARDFWFDICDKRYAPDASLLHEVHAVVTNTASKDDVSQLRSDIAQVLKTFKPDTQTRSLSVPLKPSSSKGSQELSVRDLLLLVIGAPSTRPDGQVELLCMKEFWPVKNGFRAIYNEFRQKYGDRVLRFLASYALDECKIETQGGLTEEEISKTLAMMSVQAVCMAALDDGDMRAIFNESNEIAWYACDNPP